MPSALPQSLQSQQLSQLYSYGQFRIALAVRDFFMPKRL